MHARACGAGVFVSEVGIANPGTLELPGRFRRTRADDAQPALATIAAFGGATTVAADHCE
jgi:hypothetical protein